MSFHAPSASEINERLEHAQHKSPTWNAKSFWHHLVSLNDMPGTDLEKWSAIRNAVETSAPDGFSNYVSMRTKIEDSLFILRYHLAPIDDVENHLERIHSLNCYDEWLAYCKSIGYYKEKIDKADILASLTIKPESNERLAERRQRTAEIRALQTASRFGRDNTVMWEAIHQIFVTSDSVLWITIEERIQSMLTANRHFDLYEYLKNTPNLDDIRLALRCGQPASCYDSRVLVRRLPFAEQELWAAYGVDWDYDEDEEELSVHSDMSD